MKIWRFQDPYDYLYARAGRRGTWTESKRQGVCPECTATDERRVRPLIIEWEPDSDVVGDFVWPGFGDDIAVTGRVMEALQSRFKGFEAGPVEMIQSPRLKRPKRVTKRTKPRVWLPYEGPPLFDLWVTSWVHIDLERSTVWLVKRCSTCGYERYEGEGDEQIKTEVNIDIAKGICEHFETRVPRVPGKGLFVREEDLDGADIFRIHEFPAMIVCTDEVKRFIERSGFTNVDFLELGDVIEQARDSRMALHS